MFYKKVVEASAKQELELPGFSIQKAPRMAEFPDVKDITTVNITYSLIEPFAYANIKWDAESKELQYVVIEPKVGENDLKLLKQISDGLMELVEVGLSSIKNTSQIVDYLQKQVTKVVRELGLQLEPNQYIKLMYYVYRNFVGFNEIEPLLQDPNIEDISCDGNDTPVYVIHRKFGSLKTNVNFKSADDLRDFIVKVAERTGRYVSYAEPILSGTLPDGSRVSATLAGDVATRGPTFTIRKFSENPFSPVDQIEMGTCDPQTLAYFWYLVEHGSSVLIVGGVATGKTSFLNTVSMFIPPEAKIISIEDTREIRIPHEHWIAGLARTGFGLPMPSGEKYGEVTLFDLLKESFRQNPDYVIVGEVRGEETYVMFQGMSSGHPSLATFHAGSVDTVIKRLTTPPIELSPTLIESLDVIAVMIHARERGKSARRIKEISEIVSVDPQTQDVKTNVVFQWDPSDDKYVKVNESFKVGKLAVARGGTPEEARADIERRQRVIEYLVKKQVKDFKEVSRYINMYYKEPNKLLAEIGEKPIPEKIEKIILEKQKPIGVIGEIKKPIPVPVPVAAKLQVAQTVAAAPAAMPVKKEQQKKRESILEVLGYKVYREK